MVEIAFVLALSIMDISEEDKNTCREDVKKICEYVKKEDGLPALIECMQKNRMKISEKCQKVMEKHNV